MDYNFLFILGAGYTETGTSGFEGEVREIILPIDSNLVKNLYWGTGDKFTRYNNSKARQTALSYGAIELELPELFDDIFDFIDSNDLSFSEALEHDALTLSNQSRLFGWVDAAKSNFEKAEIQLGLK